MQSQLIGVDGEGLVPFCAKLSETKRFSTAPAQLEEPEGADNESAIVVVDPAK